MPVGPTRITLATYLSTFDWLAKREAQAVGGQPDGGVRVLSALAQRREELLMAARRDRFHGRRYPAQLN